MRICRGEATSQNDFQPAKRAALLDKAVKDAHKLFGSETI